jgi:hypothetical protein
MMYRNIKIINMCNKHRNNHNIKVSLLNCPIEKEAKLALRIKILSPNMSHINDLYDNFTTLQIHKIPK